MAPRCGLGIVRRRLPVTMIEVLVARLESSEPAPAQSCRQFGMGERFGPSHQAATALISAISRSPRRGIGSARLTLSKDPALHRVLEFFATPFQDVGAGPDPGDVGDFAVIGRLGVVNDLVMCAPEGFLNVFGPHAGSPSRPGSLTGSVGVAALGRQGTCGGSCGGALIKLPPRTAGRRAPCTCAIPLESR
jgi:hypothetical protein